MSHRPDYRTAPVPASSHPLRMGGAATGAASFLTVMVQDTVQMADSPYETQGSCPSFRGAGSTPVPPSVGVQPPSEGRADSVQDKVQRTHPLTRPWLRAFDTSVGALHTGIRGAGDGVMPC